MAEHIEVVELNDDHNGEHTDACSENPASIQPTEIVTKTPEQSFSFEAGFNEIADKALDEDTTPDLKKARPRH